MLQIAEAAGSAVPDELSRFAPPPDGGRASAVLMLFGEQEAHGRVEPDVLLIERSHGLRRHAGQPAFPGGALDPGDEGPVAAALREAVEETGLDPAGVEVLARMRDIYLPPSGYIVTPVVAWWRRPSPVAVVDPAEVASVHRIPLGELLDPAHRGQVRHPAGYVGPAFHVRGLLVWGFTAMLLSGLLASAGLERPWDTGRVDDLPERALRLASGSPEAPA